MQTRREVLATFSALAVLSDVVLLPAQSVNPVANELEHSAVFSIAQLPVKPSESGTFQHVASGKLGTGEAVSIHNTTLNPGQMPHAAHRHPHTEFLVIREGSVVWLLGEQSIHAGPGDILYARSNELHGLKNVGSTVARYAVIAIGANVGQ